MLGFLQWGLTTAASFLFVLTIVVTVHELGHFWVAKACGVAIDRFSIGFGRAIARWRDRDGVEWRIGWMPLGGYVRFAGDDNAASLPDGDDLEAMRARIIEREGPSAVQRYYHFKPIWQRAAVAAAGPFANFLLAIVLFAVLLMTVGEVKPPARVDGVASGSPAAAAGFQAGDIVLKADGRPVDSFVDLQQVVALRAGAATEFLVKRGERELVLTATPRRQTIVDRIGGEQRVGVLGLQSQPRVEDYERHRYGPVEALAGGVKRTWHVLDTTLYYLGRLVTGQENADQLGGPLRIAQTSAAVAQVGAEGAHGLGEILLGSGVALLGLVAVLSVGIGFMNLLPVPVLDGGHLLFYAYEAVARRPLDARIQAAGYRVGLALLVGLMLFATWNDLQQLRVFKILGGLLS